MNLNKRILSLYKTGVPTKFVVNFAKTVQKCHQQEQNIHVLLHKYRINPSREFFKCSLQTIKTVFDGIDGVWWEDEDAIKEVKNKKTMPLKVSKPNLKRRRLGREAKHLKINYKV